MEKKAWKDLPKGKKRLAIVYTVLRYSVIAVLVAQLLNRDFESAFLCVLTLVLFLLPSFIERHLRIEMPDTLEIVILLFIYAAEILGEIRAFYITFPYWDTVLHTVNGFLCAAIGFSLVDIMNRSDKITAFHLSPGYMALAAFCFSMTVGVMWEFFERLMDMVFLFDMQKDTIVHTISTVMLDPAGGTKATAVKDIAEVILVHSDGSQEVLGLGGYLDIGIIDTMMDLFVNFIGAVTFSAIGYFYVKKRGEGKFARRFIPRVKE